MKNRQNGLCVKIAITQYVFYIKFAIVRTKNIGTRTDYKFRHGKKRAASKLSFRRSPILSNKYKCIPDYFLLRLP